MRRSNAPSNNPNKENLSPNTFTEPIPPGGTLGPPLFHPGRVPEPQERPVKRRAPAKKTPPKNGPGKRVTDPQPKAKGKPKAFRMDSKTFFLTFPHTDTSPETALVRLKALFQGYRTVEKVICSQEPHKDGSPHIHLVFQLNDAVNIRDPHYFDRICGKHGNYQTCRTFLRSVLYVGKLGNFLIEGMDYAALEKAVAKKKSSKSDTIAKDVMAGKTLKDICLKEPGYFMTQQRKIQEFQSFWSMQLNSESPLLPWAGCEACDKMSPPNAMLADWLNRALDSKKPPGLFKGVWICGETGIGKSRFLSDIRKYVPMFQIPCDRDWFDGFEDKIYRLSYLDEYGKQDQRSHKPYTWLNSWVDPYPLKLNRRGMCPYEKREPLPTIICSNFTPEQVYMELLNQNGNAFQAMKRRWEVVSFGRTEVKINFLVPPEPLDMDIGSPGTDEPQILEEGESPPKRSKVGGKTINLLKRGRNFLINSEDADDYFDGLEQDETDRGLDKQALALMDLLQTSEEDAEEEEDGDEEEDSDGKEEIED